MAFNYNKYKEAQFKSPFEAQKLWKGAKSVGRFAGKALGWPLAVLEGGLFAADWIKIGREKAWDKHKYWGDKEGDLADYYPRNLPSISPWSDKKVLKDYYKKNPHKR